MPKRKLGWSIASSPDRCTSVAIFAGNSRTTTWVMGDVLTVCRSGAVIQPPERDIRRAEWLYRIEGRTTDQDHIAIVFKFIAEEEHAVLVTVWKER